MFQIMPRSMNMQTCIAVVGFLALDLGTIESYAADSTVQRSSPKENVPYITTQYDKGRQRTIHANQAIVRSGPSEKHYATQTLQKGQSVDVYMETSDGWSGIRPPLGSHDWIPAQSAYLLPGGKTAEIVNDETPAWIGSEAANVKDLEWSIALKKSQQVQILGEELLSKKDGAKQLWYRIAAPQGEFRWVRTSQLSDQPTPPDPKVDAKSNGVTLAGYVQTSEAAVGDGGEISGEIVWSNEREVLAQLEQQIRAEQAQASQEAHGEPESIDPITQSTPLRPIPAPANHPKAKAMAHQTDSFQHWEALKNSDDPKLRVGPMRSILGLIGLSVVEAERAPPNARIAQSFHNRGAPNHLRHVGPVHSSRLDRLPRPGQRVSGTTPPTEEWSDPQGIQNELFYDSSMRERVEFDTQGYAKTSLWQRWMYGQEPIFGNRADIGQQAISMAPGTWNVPHNPAAFAAPQANQFATVATPQAMPTDTSAWHGFPTTANIDVSKSRPAARPVAYESESENVSEFTTPEIQSALVSLTQEVANPTEQWDFGALRRQASTWVESGSTAMIRGEARLLLDRIERFESIKLRSMGLVPSGSQLAQYSAQQAAPQSAPVVSNTQAASSVPPNGGVVTASAIGPNSAENTLGPTGNSAGDASGWLVQVHSSIPGQPEFALTDDAGNVIAYVQSTAALNLRRYLQQPVKIYGVRGYLPNLAAKQILAERVQRLR